MINALFPHLHSGAASYYDQSVKQGQGVCWGERKKLHKINAKLFFIHFTIITPDYQLITINMLIVIVFAIKFCIV